MSKIRGCLKSILLCLVVVLMILVSPNKINAIPREPLPTPVPAGSCGCIIAGPWCMPVGLLNKCREGLVPMCTTNLLCSQCSCEPPPPKPTPKGGVKIKPQVDPYCYDEGHGIADPYPEIRTAVGCVPIEINRFIAWSLPILFGIVGGISFLLIIYGFILIATSQGDPKKIQGAKETITSAIIGLLFAIFSLFILRLIVLDILQIPGINRPPNEV